MSLQTRAQAKSRQAVLKEVLSDLASSPGRRDIRNNDFDNPPGLNSPTDYWLDTLKAAPAAIAGNEVLAIRVKTVIEDDWVSDGYDCFKVLLVPQDMNV
jgi:hypothetical protein